MGILTCYLQLYLDGHWQDAAALDLTGDPDKGIAAATFHAYLPQHVVAYWARRDAAALSANFPVDLVPHANPGWPAFLIDLLPQGYGRVELLKQLDQASESAHLDNRLVQAGVCTMAAPLARLLEDARALGIEDAFLAPLERTWRNGCEQVAAL